MKDAICKLDTMFVCGENKTRYVWFGVVRDLEIVTNIAKKQNEQKSAVDLFFVKLNIKQ